MDTSHEYLHAFLSSEVTLGKPQSYPAHGTTKGSSWGIPMMTSLSDRPDTLPTQRPLTPGNSDVTGAICNSHVLTEQMVPENSLHYVEDSSHELKI
jgi:hypothetical protein